MKIELPIEKKRNVYGYGSSTAELADPEIVSTDNGAFFATALGTFKRFHFRSRTQVHGVKGRDRSALADWTSLAVATVHGCFDQHVGLQLSPQVVWYMIVHEVAEHVKQNAGRYSNIFTTTPGEKRKIKSDLGVVHAGTPWEWAGVIPKIRRPLREAVTGETMDLFLPNFSTSTEEDEIALLVAFMDAASPYYGYEYITCCGIPSVNLTGEARDWELLLMQTEQLARAFPGLDAYFADLLPVIAKIANTAAGAALDEQFWTSIYKYDGGSGGPYINGWLTAFFAHINTYRGLKPRTEFGWEQMAKSSFGGLTTDQFPSHVSHVPFEWTHHGNKMPPMALAAGIIGVDHTDDGSLAPALGFAVIES
jgi:hypothetical protein